MSKKILTALLVCFSLLALGFSTVAEARRLGGGRSSGFQRQVPTTPRQTQAPVTPQQPGLSTARPTANPGMAQSQGWRRWAGPLAGIAAGLGLAALFSHMGIGSGMGGMLIMVLGALLVFMVLRKLFSGLSASAPQPRQAYAGANTDVVTPFQQRASAVETGSAASAGNVPAGFDAAAFVHQAKVNFIRLQAANDARNLDDIRDFTSPEMFAEIKLEMDQRGAAAQRTDVVLLEAEVLEVVEESQRYVASVHFHGSLREEAELTPQGFDEIWHLSKPRDGSRGWVLAGIQQLN